MKDLYKEVYLFIVEVIIIVDYVPMCISISTQFKCQKTALFQTIQFSISTQFKCQKQFYFKLFSLINEVKWFQVFLCITNNSVKH